jgi:hypothetical protein
MIALMKKPFLAVCLFVAGVVGIAVSCGPQKAFCPNRADNECVNEVDSGALTGAGGTMQADPCDGGARCTTCGSTICCSVGPNCIRPQ